MEMACLDSSNLAPIPIASGNHIKFAEFGRLKVVKSALFRANAESLFAAVASPAGIQASFSYLLVEMECRAGGALAFHGLAEGLPFVEVGIVDCYEAPRLLQFRYARGGPGVEILAPSRRVLRIEVEPVGDDHGRLTIGHGGFANADEMSAAAAYWEHFFDKLPAVTNWRAA